MSFTLLAALLILSAYGVANCAGAALVAALWLSSARLRRAAGARSAHLLFVLRIYPPVFGATVALVLVLPAFLEHELRGGQGEEIGPGLVLLALTGLVPLVGGLVRGVRSLAATHRFERDLRLRARPLLLQDTGVAGSRVEHLLPAAVLCGVFRPRLYVSESVLVSLTPGELRATCAHERAHAASRDNLKSLLLRACPDWLAALELGARIERAWAAAAEQAADDAAARGDAASRLDLASALVKVARLATHEMRPAGSTASFLDGGELSVRVARLLGNPGPEEETPAVAWVLPVCLALLVAPLLLPDSSRLIHAILERALHLAL